MEVMLISCFEDGKKGVAEAPKMARTLSLVLAAVNINYGVRRS